MNIQEIEQTINDIRARAVGVAQDVAGIAEQRGNQEIAQSARATAGKIGNALGLSEGNLLPSEINMSLAPVTPVNTTPITSAIAGFTAGQAKTQEQINQDLETQKGTATAKEPTKETFLSNLMGVKKPEAFDSQQAYLDTLQRFGYTPESIAKQTETLGQLTALNNEIKTLEDQKAQALGNAELQYQGRLTDVLRGEKGIIERQYNSRIAAKSTTAALISQQYQMERGQIQDAQAITQQIVELATWDYKQKVDDYQWTINTYKDLFNMMSDKENKEWEKQFETTKFEYQQAQDKISNALAWSQENRLGAEATTGIGKTYTDEEIRATIRDDIRQGSDYQTIVDAITTNTDIANKDRATSIARELFNLPKETTKKPVSFYQVTKNLGISTPGSFFANLFSQ